MLMSHYQMTVLKDRQIALTFQTSLVARFHELCVVLAVSSISTGHGAVRYCSAVRTLQKIVRSCSRSDYSPNIL